MKKIYTDFENMAEARKAMEALKNMGFQHVHLDAVDNFHTEFAQEIGVTDVFAAPSLSAVFLQPRGRTNGVGTGPLMSTNPLVSRTTSFEEPSQGLSTRLFAAVEDNEVDKVRMVLKSHK